jgi:hypothetical protein
MKKFFLILISVILIGCGNDLTTEEERIINNYRKNKELEFYNNLPTVQKDLNTYFNKWDNHEIIVIDSCEYIFVKKAI